MTTTTIVVRRMGRSVPIRHASTLSQLNFPSLYTLIDLAGKNPTAAGRHLLRMNATVKDVRAEINVRKAMQAKKAVATAEKKRRNEEMERREHEVWLATPVGQQAMLVQGIEDYMLDCMKDGSRPAMAEYRRLDSMCSTEHRKLRKLEIEERRLKKAAAFAR